MSGDSAQEDSNSVTAARSRLTKLNGRFILKSFPHCRSVSSRGVFLNLKSEVSAAAAVAYATARLWSIGPRRSLGEGGTQPPYQATSEFRLNKISLSVRS